MSTMEHILASIGIGVLGGLIYLLAWVYHDYKALSDALKDKVDWVEALKDDGVIDDDDERD